MPEGAVWSSKIGFRLPTEVKEGSHRNPNCKLKFVLGKQERLTKGKLEVRIVTQKETLHQKQYQDEWKSNRLPFGWPEIT
ncbi:hypothetical protein F0562_011059 [Nyssa sinensis]|uniref:Uncharacterized protein n=1 Tax=Nyssa sinensis TaxID=561372 RepID=A0A5J5A3L8_9ASTE|nr:hypothetical protein F0562_011059 [Nyssa sinensis]